MLTRCKNFCTSRKIVVALFLLLTGSLLAATIFPQSRGGRPAAGGDGTASSGLPELLGLDHIFSTWWFVGLSALFVFSLLLSTLDQYRAARRKVAEPPAAGDEGYAPCTLGVEQVAAILRREGYRLLAEKAGIFRYVKGAVGYWGNFSLHLGMVVTLAFSLVYVLTEHRMIVRVVEQETIPVRPGSHPERKGFFAGTLPLPDAVVLEGLDAQFHANDAVKHISSNLLFADKAGGHQTLKVGQSDKQTYRDLIVYQQNAFGLTFYLDFAPAGGEAFRQVLMLPMPMKRDAAAYGRADIDNGRYLLKAKFYANADRSGMSPQNPQLVLRLYDREQLLGEVTMVDGIAEQLGPYTVTLHGSRWWTEILFEGSRGMLGIFCGFGILFFGGMLAFFAVPREVLLRCAGERAELRWRAARFHHFYLDEYAIIAGSCLGDVGGTSDVTRSQDTGSTETT